MLKVYLALSLFPLLMAGCAFTARQPAISDIRSDVVKVQTTHNILTADPTPQQIRAEAQRGCREYGNVVSHSLSNRCIRTDDFGYCMQREYLFACKPPAALDPPVPDPTP